MLAFDGPEAGGVLVVLAPGDAGRLTDRAPTQIASVLGASGLRVVRFACPCLDTTDDTRRDAALADRIREAAGCAGGRRVVLGGLSRGARVSTTLLSELGGVGLLGFGYPFHARQDPDPGSRVRDLARIEVPALICQGTRDSHGNRQQVRGYRLPAHIQMHWLEDANHALMPRPRSGQQQAQQLREAALVAARFVRGLE